ncbi:MAG TPA: PaaI family thioesterase [Planctomycetota bacterium]|nr:PaaI family thioesterase [Planctomycetota bacterium]
MTTTESLQDKYGKAHRCFGCGPANPQGLQIKSRVEGEVVVADWTPQRHHEAFEGTLSGGICGTLLDCHSNWTAAWHLMRTKGLDAPPSTVTAEFHVKLLAPTPTDGPLRLTAKVVESSSNRAVVESTIEAKGKVTATCRGVFVAVPPGHPAYHRW